MKTVLKYLVNTLTVILLILLTIVVYGKCSVSFGKKLYPDYFGYTLFEVVSGSMEPTLYINDVVLVKIQKEDVKKDDIITFMYNNDFITHRVLLVDGDTITVKGDNNNTIDTPINRNQVVGKVIKIFPKLSVWKKVLTEPKIIIAVFVTFLLFDFALSYQEPKKGKQKKKQVLKKENVATEPVIKEIKVEDQVEKKPIKKDVVLKDDLLDMTRKIDINEINDLLDNKEVKINKIEKENFEREIEKQKVDNKKEEKKVVVEKKKEEQDIEYTARLDLNKIQSRIKSKVK